LLEQGRRRYRSLEVLWKEKKEGSGDGERMRDWGEGGLIICRCRSTMGADHVASRANAIGPLGGGIGYGIKM
jgi:hypothetical protein